MICGAKILEIPEIGADCEVKGYFKTPQRFCNTNMPSFSKI